MPQRLTLHPCNQRVVLAPRALAGCGEKSLESRERGDRRSDRSRDSGQGRCQRLNLCEDRHGVISVRRDPKMRLRPGRVKRDGTSPRRREEPRKPHFRVFQGRKGLDSARDTLCQQGNHRFSRKTPGIRGFQAP